MPKRMAVVLSGCGAGDGSDVREATFTLLSIERAGAQAVCAAPDLPQPVVVDHARAVVTTDEPSRGVLAEAARLAPGRVRALADLDINDFDALVFPGGLGVETVLSNHATRGELCEVQPDVVRLLKAALASHRPIGVMGLAGLLAARVLGPVAGVHLTIGARGTPAAKHAIIMGADVRPCANNDIFLDRKNRVISTPASVIEGIRLTEMAAAIDKLVRSVLHLARDRNPAPRPPAQATPGRGSV